MSDYPQPMRPSWQDCDHGDECDCLLLARAIGAGPEAVDTSYCRQVLQRHWRVKCNHGARERGAKQTPVLPARDPADGVQALLVANA